LTAKRDALERAQSLASEVSGGLALALASGKLTRRVVDDAASKLAEALVQIRAVRGEPV
jgi:hypothetical protein